jgi:TatD DNase family protein
MIDTHSHVYLCKKDPAELVAAAEAAGVSAMICVGLDKDTALTCAELASRFPGVVYPTLGVHPCEKNDLSPSELQDLLTQHPWVAIGEVGLDYYKSPLSPSDQRQRFVDHLELARQASLPVIIHNRQADADMMAVVADFPDVAKVFHCFSSDMAFVEKTIGLNSMYSFTGNITFSPEGPMVEALRHLPLDRIMSETDCPFLTPASHKGQPNEPAFVKAVVQKLADIKGIPFQEMARITTENARRFFRLN